MINNQSRNIKVLEKHKYILSFLSMNNIIFLPLSDFFWFFSCLIKRKNCTWRLFYCFKIKVLGKEIFMHVEHTISFFTFENNLIILFVFFMNLLIIFFEPCVYYFSFLDWNLFFEITAYLYRAKISFKNDWNIYFEHSYDLFYKIKKLYFFLLNQI